MKFIGVCLIFIGLLISGRAMKNSELAAKYGEHTVANQAFSNILTEGCLGWLIGMSIIGFGIYLLMN